MSEEAYASGAAVKRFRSPPYPAMDLSKAIDRAKTLYGKALHHPVPSNVLADAWKYGIKSSGMWATAAALIQYGLLTDSGSGGGRRFTLTDAAIRIIRDADPASPKRAEAIRRAALQPPIFRELWDNFGAADLSDVVVANFLTLDRSEAGKAPYGDGAAADIIEAYKATIAFAGVTGGGSLPDTDEDKSAVEMEAAAPAPEPLAQGVKDPVTPAPPASSLGEVKRSEVKLMTGERELVTGLLSKDASFRVIVSGAIGVKEIDRLIRKLELDKEILAEADEDEAIGRLA